MSYQEQTVTTTTALTTTYLQHLEDGIEDASSRLDTIEPAVQGIQDSLTALGAGGLGGGGAGGFPGGATLPAPTLNAAFILNATTPLWADGSNWRLFTDNTVLSGAGGANAPTGMTAVVQSDNSIVLSWTAPIGVTVTSLQAVRAALPVGCDRCGCVEWHDHDPHAGVDR